MSMRKALIVGINRYKNIASLNGCVNDARSVAQVLARHGDNTINFDVRSLLADEEGDEVHRDELLDAIKDLFNTDCDIALFYFAGHGSSDSLGTYLLTSDSNRPDSGVSLSEVLTLANKCQARSKIILLDCCHSGSAGTPPSRADAELSEGLTILTAATSEQYASEEDGHGVFTSLLVDALNGAAANVVGSISPGAVYAHVDQSLGQWDQRPVFKTNVKNFVSLRQVAPRISLADLRRIAEFFPRRGSTFPLDPSFEPEDEGRTPGMPPANPDNVAKFAILQACNRVGLVVPDGAPHMWHAAMQSKSCKLTDLGEHYRRLVEKGRI